MANEAAPTLFEALDADVGFEKALGNFATAEFDLSDDDDDDNDVPSADEDSEMKASMEASSGANNVVAAADPPIKSISAIARSAGVSLSKLLPKQPKTTKTSCRHKHTYDGVICRNVHNFARILYGVDLQSRPDKET